MRQAGLSAVWGLLMFAVGGLVPCPRVQAEPAATTIALASPLEDTAWSVKLTPDEAAKQQGEKPFEDGLSFKNGKVTMSACIKMGFAPSTYAAAPVGGAWTLTTEQVSPDEGRTKWTAEISGNAIHGTMVWTKKDGATLRYTFQGTKEAAPSAS